MAKTFAFATSVGIKIFGSEEEAQAWFNQDMNRFLIHGQLEEYEEIVMDTKLCKEIYAHIWDREILFFENKEDAVKSIGDEDEVFTYTLEY